MPPGPACAGRRARRAAGHRRSGPSGAPRRAVSSARWPSIRPSGIRAASTDWCSRDPPSTLPPVASSASCCAGCVTPPNYRLRRPATGLPAFGVGMTTSSCRGRSVECQLIVGGRAPGPGWASGGATMPAEPARAERADCPKHSCRAAPFSAHLLAAPGRAGGRRAGGHHPGVAGEGPVGGDDGRLPIPGRADQGPDSPDAVTCRNRETQAPLSTPQWGLPCVPGFRPPLACVRAFTHQNLMCSIDYPLCS